MIVTYPMGGQQIEKQKCSNEFEPLNSAKTHRGPGIRIVRVYEQESFQDHFLIENIPKSVIL